MCQWLRQSTAVTVKLGQFVDAADGFTPETGLTISQADIRLTKNGGAFAQTNNSAGATHDENGFYGVPLNATDTNTLGTLTVAVTETGARPVKEVFMVVPQQVWDSYFGSDLLQIDMIQHGGTNYVAGAIAGSSAGSPGGAALTQDVTTVGASVGAVATAVATLASNQANLLDTDTYVEPSVAPPATTTLAKKIGYLYQMLRNKVIATATLKRVYKDDGTALWSKVISDDGTTYTEEEGS